MPLLRSVLSRRAGALAFGGYALFIVVLTTWPLEFHLDAAAIRDKWSQTEWVLFYWTPTGQILIDHDLVLNILFFVPLGAAWAVMTRPRSRWSAAASALLAGVALSVFVEGLQVLTPDRSTQLADVWRNGLGAGLAALAAQPLVKRWTDASLGESSSRRS